MTERNASVKPDSWDAFFDALKGVNVPEDFLCREKQSEKAKDPFEGCDDKSFHSIAELSVEDWTK